MDHTTTPVDTATTDDQLSNTTYRNEIRGSRASVDLATMHGRLSETVVTDDSHTVRVWCDRLSDHNGDRCTVGVKLDDRFHPSSAMVEFGSDRQARRLAAQIIEHTTPVDDDPLSTVGADGTGVTDDETRGIGYGTSDDSDGRGGSPVEGAASPTGDGGSRGIGNDDGGDGTDSPSDPVARGRPVDGERPVSDDTDVTLPDADDLNDVVDSDVMLEDEDGE